MSWPYSLMQFLDKRCNKFKRIFFKDEKSLTQYDLYSEKWVYDNKFALLYNERECSFLIDDYACQKFGRNDEREYSFLTDEYACQKFGRNESIYQH